MPDGGRTKGLGTASRRRRQLPGATLIEFELGLGLSGQLDQDVEVQTEVHARNDAEDRHAHLPP
jgi:hypothetical protein